MIFGMLVLLSKWLSGRTDTLKLSIRLIYTNIHRMYVWPEKNCIFRCSVGHPSNALCGKSKRKAREFELKYSTVPVSASIGGQPQKTKEGDLQSPFGSHPRPYFCPIFIFALMHICILILLLALLTSRKYRFSLLRRPFDKTTPAQPWTPSGKCRKTLKTNVKILGKN